MGLEMCGTIRQTGDQVCGWSVGDRVLALLSGGGYAEQVAVHADHLIALPDDWGFASRSGRTRSISDRLC